MYPGNKFQNLLHKKQVYKSRLIAGGISLILIVEYLLAEAIAASVWKSPVYSYSQNFISDLGVSGGKVVLMGRVINSPLYWLMNTAFLVEGLLTLIAAFLLRPLFSSTKWRITLPLFAIIHCAGMFMVAIVHGSPQAFQQPIGILHVIGAFLAIVFGNIQCICSGIAASRSGAPGWYKSYSIFCGLLGIAALICLAVSKTVQPGISERGSVYTIILWDITTGIFLLNSIKKAKL
jgi:hypothetical membrane protein